MVSLDDYLKFESDAAYKSEYYAGRVYAMEGGSEKHSRLSARAVSLLDSRLSCRVYDSNLKLYMAARDQCVYPDAMAICGEPRFLHGRNDVILNPSVVVEVLSPSTAAHDRGSKTDDYRTIPSLTSILLLSQDRVSIELFARSDARVWVATRYEDAGDRVAFAGCEIAVQEFYRGIL